MVWIIIAITLAAAAICSVIGRAAKDITRLLEERLPVDAYGNSETLRVLQRIERMMILADHRAAGRDMDAIYEGFERADEAENRRKFPWLYVDEDQA